MQGVLLSKRRTSGEKLTYSTKRPPVNSGSWRRGDSEEGDGVGGGAAKMLLTLRDDHTQDHVRVFLEGPTAAHAIVRCLCSLPVCDMCTLRV